VKSWIVVALVACNARSPSPAATAPAPLPASSSPAAPATTPAAGALRLMTYNVEYNNPDRDATIAAIASADADLVLLQEITQTWQDELTARLGDRYPHRLFHLHDRKAGGLAVLSKLPLDGDELFASPATGWFPAERFTVRAPVGDVQVMNVHLRPAIDRNGWVSGFFTTQAIRVTEVTAYAQHLTRDVPTIVAGDFNEYPGGGAVEHLLATGLARVPAVGPATWHYVDAANQDLLRFDLDHILLGKLAARDAVVLDVGTSDHRPVVATITTP
jgi:endonuclease/exonuclease/phosphatase (EEP) superfamily protein YafD